MTRIRDIIGFETGALMSEGSTDQIFPRQGESVGSVAFEGTIVRTGIGSLKVTPASGAAGYWRIYTGLSSVPARFCRLYVRITSLPATGRSLCGQSGAFHIFLNPSGTLQLKDGAVPIGSASTVALTDTTSWYRIETDLSGSVATLYIDGVNEASGSSTLTTNIAIFGANDTVASTYTAYFDDIAYDDAVLPGEGRAVLLVPTSDNARDTLWTGGAGGTTNLFSAIDNIPPNGKATETDLTQIEHAGGSAGTTDRYDANTTSYSAAGIDANDIINAVQGIIITGEDSATGDKLLNFQILSNPVGTATGNFNVADSVSGATGDFPSGWWVSRTPITNSPSVTLGTSPVLRVIRPETASRVASVCFMGIYVDYTPVAVSATRKFQRASILGV